MSQTLSVRQSTYYRWFIVVLTLALTAVLVVVTASLHVHAASATTSGPAPIPANGMLFGASVRSSGSTSSTQQLATLEAQTGRTLAISRVYSNWDDQQPATQVTDDVAYGRVPLVSIVPHLRSGTILAWAAIANGTYDTDIRRQADALRTVNGPVLLSFHHEANLASGYGSAADFRAAFVHYVAVVRSEGATNVAFVLILTPRAYLAAADWYPGPDYVDWIGTDAYNFGGCKAGVPAWTSLQQSAQPFYDWGSTTGKPLVLAEWGAPEDPNDPNRRAAWIAAAATTLAGWPQLKAAAYFDIPGTCDWTLTPGSPAFNAFASLAHNAFANGLPTSWIRPASSIGAAPLTDTFDLSASTGSGSTTGSGILAWTVDFGDGTSTSGTGKPATVTHTFAAGSFHVTAVVTDAYGQSAPASTNVQAAAPPTVSEGGTLSHTADAAIMAGWINTHGVAGTYYPQWGITSAYTWQSTPVNLTNSLSAQAVTTTLTGLTPGVHYHWRIVAVTPAGTTFGNDHIVVI